MISLTDISKTYCNLTKEKHGIFNINLSLPDKGLYIINGRSGCGKTTLLHVLGLIDSFDTGEYCINETVVNKLTVEERADFIKENIGYVFQDYKLFEDLSVKDNISITQDYPLEMMEEYLKDVDLTEYMNTKVKFLSGGEKQRVAILRALIKKPTILLCDEPTGNLDSKTSRSIMDLLKKCSEDILVIVVSHDEELSRQYTNNIFSMEDGKIITKIKKSDTPIKSKNDTLANNNMKINKKSKHIYKGSKSLFNSKKSSIGFIILQSLLGVCGFACGSSLSFDKYEMTYQNLERLNMNENISINLGESSKELYNNHASRITNYSQCDLKYNFLGSTNSLNIYESDLNISKKQLNLLSGRLPVNNKEIVISDYINDGYVFNNSQMLSIDGTNRHIVGVFKTAYSDDENIECDYGQYCIYSVNSYVNLRHHFYNELADEIYNVEMFNNASIAQHEIILNSCFLDLCKYSQTEIVGKKVSDALKDELTNSLNLIADYVISDVVDDENTAYSFYINFENMMTNYEFILLYSQHYYSAKSANDLRVLEANGFELDGSNHQSEKYANVYGYDVYNMLEPYIHIIKIVSLSIGALILVIDVLFILKEMLNMVHNKNEQIGILLVNGFKKKEILISILLRFTILGLISLGVYSLINIGTYFIMNASIMGNFFLKYTSVFKYSVISNFIIFFASSILTVLFSLILLSPLNKRSICQWMKGNL